MDIDALLIRVGKLEAQIAALDPSAAAKIAELLQGAEPLLSQAAELSEKIADFSKKLDDHVEVFTSMMADTNGRIAALESAPDVTPAPGFAEAADNGEQPPVPDGTVEEGDDKQ